MKPKIKLIPLGSAEEFQDEILFCDKKSTTLKQLFEKFPFQSLDKISIEQMEKTLSTIRIDVMNKVSESTILYDPPNTTSESSVTNSEAGRKTDIKSSESINLEEKTPTQNTAKITEKSAVEAAYFNEIESIASFLRIGNGLSVLVYCDKLIVQHLWEDIVRKANREAVVLGISKEDVGGESLMGGGSMRQRQLAQLKQDIDSLKDGQVLVIPHLDLIAGGSENSLSNEAGEITELVYKYTDRVILAFADRSITIPEVLSARFSMRSLITGVSQTVVDSDGSSKLLGEYFVSKDEAKKFKGYEPENLYKNVAGMNPIHILHAIAYAVKEKASSETVPVEELYDAIRAFKAQKSANFEVPDVGFEHIGGYEDVKAIMMKALSLMKGGYELPDETLRNELVPRGFIFHGPPGTGKTLFAKAIANKLGATVQVVAGPEVTDMYVGESERKVREIFAEARRNAPSVLVFDEFDAIASKRTGRDDGGSRAGNAVVAQILTEMDGFRPDVPMLVIGTTNQLGLIDEALLRPSRFQAIKIDLPDKTARRAIADVHAKHFKIREYLSEDLLDLIGHATKGFNGDEIRSIFREACVGLYCETPPQKIDAYQIGRLIGNIRHNSEKRNLETSSQVRHMPVDLAGSAIPEPSPGMISLTDDDS